MFTDTPIQNHMALSALEILRGLREAGATKEQLVLVSETQLKLFRMLSFSPAIMREFRKAVELFLAEGES